MKKIVCFGLLFFLLGSIFVSASGAAAAIIAKNRQEEQQKHLERIGFLDSNELKEFEKENNCRLKFDSFSSSELICQSKEGLHRLSVSAAGTIYKHTFNEGETESWRNAKSMIMVLATIVGLALIGKFLVHVFNKY